MTKNIAIKFIDPTITVFARYRNSYILRMIALSDANNVPL